MNSFARLLPPVLLILLAGCDARAPRRGSPSGPQAYETRGVVREIADDRRTAVIRHEEIPGYMPAMVMELIVRDTNELAGISAGDAITFRLHDTGETHWIDTIRRVGRAAGEPAAGPGLLSARAARELGPGDALPDAELLGEAGKPVRFSDFRGRALALTFFFTRCPLPDYCPRMNRHFAEARRLLRECANAPTNWQLLCVSFDAEFDRPQVLQGYASAYRGNDPDRWLFASASAEVIARLAPLLDLLVLREGAGFSHNLRTVVLDPQGRIHRQFDGNDWTPQQLADAVAEAARLTDEPLEP